MSNTTPTVSTAGASGIYDFVNAMQYSFSGNWPTSGVLSFDYLIVAGGGGVESGIHQGGGGAGAKISTATSGGSGIVILRYSNSYPAATSTTGSPTVTDSGGYRIYQFTSSGTITF